MERQIKVQLLQKEISLADYIENYLDIDRFLNYCKECPDYGLFWVCPPLSFNAEDFWRQYDSLLLYGKKIMLPRQMTEIQYSQEDLNALVDSLLADKKREITADLLKMEKYFPGSKALAAGKCDGCVVCSRQLELECPKPFYARYSLEALGGDVVKTAKDYLGVDLLWPKNGYLPEYFFLLGGLLKKKGHLFPDDP